MLLNGLMTYLAAFFLTLFYASVSLAAENDLSLHSDPMALTMQPTTTNESPLKTTIGIDSECFAQYFTSSGSAITTLEGRDMPLISVKDYLEDTAAIILHKDGDRIIWSLAPSLGRISLNPIDDIKNIQVLVKCRF